MAGKIKRFKGEGAKLMKKRIFILSQWMKIGGIESSLLSLLKELDYSKVAVDLCLQHHEGLWMNEIPKEVNLLPYDRKIARVGIGLATARKDGDWLVWILTQASRYLTGILYMVFRHRKVDEIGYGQIAWAMKSWLLPKRIGNGSYDLCLIFGGAPGFAARVDAKVKAAWVHTDWSYFKPLRWLARRQFSSVDYVVNVSEAAKRAFNRVVGGLPGVKSIVVENILSKKWIRERHDAYRVDAGCGFHLLSVGRLSAAKNFFRAIEAAKILKMRHIAYTWLVVGDGESRDGLVRTAMEAELGDMFQFVGARENPYPYYKWCDALVCTSDYEGKSVSVREAQIIAKPAVVTKFPTAASQVEDGVDGILVECTAEAVADGILRLINDSKLRVSLSANCRYRDYANLAEIDKILAL